MQLLTGHGSPSTIRDQIASAAYQFRLDYDRVSVDGGATLGGWKPGGAKTTMDGKNVCPANKATAVLYQYTPYVGKDWGGTHGGNSLFSDIYYDTLGFGKKPEFCGLFVFGKPTPTGDVQTKRPTVSVGIQGAPDCATHSVGIQGAPDCATHWTLSIDGAQAASGSFAGSGTASHTPTADLKAGKHTVKVQLEAPDCGAKDIVKWTFKG